MSHNLTRQVIERSYDFMDDSQCMSQPVLCDLAKPCDQWALLLSDWEPLNGISPPAKLVDHRHYGSGDEIFLEVEKQDTTCSLYFAITICPRKTLF